ncbi:MAG: hypothetical protein H8E76_05965 [Helicobacteraceae bacterium]|nr:hypothetical protein [Candidatus Sulfurimonas ponti]MBL6973156.1 hypothetical protein [Sulfurimonas sp.]
MLKFLLIVSLCYSFAFASEKETATKIVQAIVATVNTYDQAVWIQKNDKELLELLDVNRFNISDTCKDAGVLILQSSTSFSGACKDKPIVVLDYDILKDHKNAVAAFFWKKGRPNIVFIKDRIEKFNIVLPPSYEIYLEETIW